MPETRMGLKEAGKLLGLSPNGVRARAARHEIRHETDNRGKWWVFLDPDTIANDASKLRPTVSSNVGSTASSKPVDFEAERRALEAHIGTLTTALADARAEIADLKPKAETAARLQAQLDALQARFGDKAGEVEHLRAALSEANEERRKLVADLLEKIDAKAENLPAERPSWLFRLWGRGKG